MKQFLKPLILISSVLAIYGCSKVTVSENNIFNPLPASSAAITSVGFLNGNPDTTAFPTTAVPSATPLVVSDVKIILENSPPLAYNVTVSISANPGLLTSGFTPLPAGAMTFPSTVVIPAGSVSGTLPVTLNNTSSLSLSTVYGYGFTITVASNGSMPTTATATAPPMPRTAGQSFWRCSRPG